MTAPLPPSDPYDPYRRTEVQEQVVVEQDQVIARPSLPAQIARVIWLVTGFVEAAIAIRVLLKLIAANPASPFAAIVYGFTDLFLWPFMGLTATPAAAGMVLEISSIIAMFVYALLAWGLVEVVYLIFAPSRTRTRVRDVRRRY